MNKQIFKLSAAITFLIIVQFSNVVAQQPRTPKQWFELGKIQNDQKQYSQAVKAFSECIRLDKTAYTCFINRGVAYFNLKKQTEAISDYSAAIRLNPKSVDAYNNRGVSNVELKKYSEAKSDFTKALEIEPNNKAATDNLAKLEKITDVNYFGDLGDIDWDSYILKKVCLSGNCVNGKGKSDDYRGIYEGDFVDNKFNGQGKATYSNGETYEGQWFQDFKMLEGKATFPNGDSYNGNYAFGKFQFQGTYTYKNGNYYIGEWKDGKRNGNGKEFTKATNITREGTWKDDIFVGATKPNTAVSNTATLLRETLNGKFDLMENKPLVYKLTNKKSGETLVYRIEFINDGGKLAFKWKETTKNEQSEKLIITDKALVSATKYINFFNAKTSISPDNEIAFILSQTLYEELKNNDEISIDFGIGPKTMVFFKEFFEPVRQNYQNKSLALLHLQSGDGMTQIKILDDPICPLIVEINTLLYKFKLQG